MFWRCFGVTQWGATVGRSTVSDSKWLTLAKDSSGVLRAKSTKQASVESALYTWFSGVRAHSLWVNDDMVTRKSKQVCDKLSATDFLYSRGCFRGFKKRHDICLSKALGDVDSVSAIFIQSGREQLQQDLAGYGPKIYL